MTGPTNQISDLDRHGKGGPSGRKVRRLPSRRSGLRALGFGRTGLIGLHLMPVAFAWLAGQAFGSALIAGDGWVALASFAGLIGVAATGTNLLHRYAIDPHLRRQFLAGVAPEDLIFPPHLQPGWPGHTSDDPDGPDEASEGDPGDSDGAHGSQGGERV